MIEIPPQLPDDTLPSLLPDPNPRRRKFMTTLAIVAGFLLVVNAIFLVAPRNFPDNKIIYIPNGWSVASIAEHLHKEGIIRSPIIFKIIVRLTGQEDNLIAGYYLMDDRPSLIEITDRLMRGEYHLVPMKVIIFEGFDNRQVAKKFKDTLPGFNEERFLQLAADKEGFLYPDTYFFLPGTNEEDLIKAMTDNFDKKMEPLREQIENSNRSLKEIITMASIIEREANTHESRKVISGILWKRIDVEMPLQVDAVFPYFMNKNTFTLTLEDLKHDSPYNTYKYKGLPPGPIANPGYDSIATTLSPKSTPYWFYLSDMDGNMHYAQNFNEHKKNKRMYLP